MSTHKRDSFIQRAFSVGILALALLVSPALAQKVVDIPTRPGVTQRMIIISPANPKAAVVLFSGGLGGLQIFPNGSFKLSEKNFLVRTRQLFADQGLLVALVDAPSDRQSPPYLGGFRQKPEHAADIKAVIAWLRQQSKVPVWLVGTSRGTVSAAFVATELAGHDGPDGIVLTSTILADDNSPPVPAMPLERSEFRSLLCTTSKTAARSAPSLACPRLWRSSPTRLGSRCCPSRGGRTETNHVGPWHITGSTDSKATLYKKPLRGFSQNSPSRTVADLRCGRSATVFRNCYQLSGNDRLHRSLHCSTKSASGRLQSWIQPVGATH